MAKDRIKWFLIGSIVTGLISSTVLAAPIQKAITVGFNNIKIFVDDSLVTPKDAGGNVVEPFVYNGTTYLPVRAVSDALGKAVTWDGKTSSIYIGKHDSTEIKAYLSDLSPIYKSDGDFGSVVTYIDKWSGNDNTGKYYATGLSFTAYSYMRQNSIEYNLDGKYNKLKALYVLSEKTKSTQSTANINIYADGKYVSGTQMTHGILPIPVDINLEGVLRLKIEIVGENVPLGITIGLVDAKLY